MTNENESMEEYLRELEKERQIIFQEYLSLPEKDQLDPEVFKKYCYRASGMYMLEHTSEKIKGDPHLVAIAVECFGTYAYPDLPEDLKYNHEVALAYARHCNIGMFTKLPKEFRDDPEFMLEVITAPHLTNRLKSVGVNVKCNRDIVMRVAKLDPGALQYLRNVSKKKIEPLFNDEEVVLAVAKRDPQALHDLFPKYWLFNEEVQELIFKLSDKKTFVKKLGRFPWGLLYIDEQYWQDNKKLLEDGLEKDEKYLLLVREVFSQGEQSDIFRLLFPGAELDDGTIVEPLENTDEAVNYLSKLLDEEPDIIKFAIVKYWDIAELLSE